MWRSYLAAGFQAMRSNKAYTVLNVLGLAIGVAVAVLIFLYVSYETSYDRWLPQAERIHRIETTMKGLGTEPIRQPIGPRVAIETLKREFPQIEDAVGVSTGRSTIRIGNTPIYAEVARVDGNFFDVFDLRFLHGTKASALTDLSSIVVTRSEASRLFGEADPIGRTVDLERNGRRSTFRVSAVIEDVPANSHLDIDAITRFNPAEEDPGFLTSWSMLNTRIYVRLAPGSHSSIINERLPAIERRHMGPMDQMFDLRLAPITDIHLSPPLKGETTPAGDPVAVKAFAIIAASILLIACFNFINLATASASRRAREVGLRKVLGASRGQLITQFMTESSLLVAIATLLGLSLVELSLPYFNRMLGIALSLSYLGAEGILVPALGLTFFVAVLSGFYPALYLSRFHPARVLRANTSLAAGGAGRLRSGLVVAQFAVAITLIVCAAVVYAQTIHVRKSDPGFERHGLLVLKNVSTEQIGPARDALRHLIERVPGVTSVASGSSLPGGSVQMGVSARRPQDRQGASVEQSAVDPQFVRTLGIELVAGRNFSERIGGDRVGTPSVQGAAPSSGPPAAKLFNILVNEAAVDHFEFGNAEGALGQDLLLGQDRGTIVGVLRDVRYGSTREAVTPQIFFYDPSHFSSMAIRFRARDRLSVRRGIERIWQRFAPDVPFEVDFAEDVMAEHYEADAVRAQVFAIAAGLAVSIACLGIFGLAAFATERRKLEIAVRKVFGAQNADIVRLMVWQFSLPVVMANLIAWPLSWWLLRDWLNGFGDRISLHPGWFVGAGVLALVIAILTVGGHALGASRRNPAPALRSE